jgi:hypothetical protein
LPSLETTTEAVALQLTGTDFTVSPLAESMHVYAHRSIYFIAGIG